MNKIDERFEDIRESAHVFKEYDISIKTTKRSETEKYIREHYDFKSIDEMETFIRKYIPEHWVSTKEKLKEIDLQEIEDAR